MWKPVTTRLFSNLGKVPGQTQKPIVWSQILLDNQVNHMTYLDSFQPPYPIQDPTQDPTQDHTQDPTSKFSEHLRHLETQQRRLLLETTSLSQSFLRLRSSLEYVKKSQALIREKVKQLSAKKDPPPEA